MAEPMDNPSAAPEEAPVVREAACEDGSPAPQLVDDLLRVLRAQDDLDVDFASSAGSAPAAPAAGADQGSGASTPRSPLSDLNPDADLPDLSPAPSMASFHADRSAPPSPASAPVTGTPPPGSRRASLVLASGECVAPGTPARGTPEWPSFPSPDPQPARPGVRERSGSLLPRRPGLRRARGGSSAGRESPAQSLPDTYSFPDSYGTPSRGHSPPPRAQSPAANAAGSSFRFGASDDEDRDVFAADTCRGVHAPSFETLRAQHLKDRERDCALAEEVAAAVGAEWADPVGSLAHRRKTTGLGSKPGSTSPLRDQMKRAAKTSVDLTLAAARHQGWLFDRVRTRPGYIPRPAPAAAECDDPAPRPAISLPDVRRLLGHADPAPACEGWWLVHDPPGDPAVSPLPVADPAARRRTSTGALEGRRRGVRYARLPVETYLVLAGRAGEAYAGRGWAGWCFVRDPLHAARGKKAREGLPAAARLMGKREEDARVDVARTCAVEALQEGLVVDGDVLSAALVERLQDEAAPREDVPSERKRSGSGSGPGVKGMLDSFRNSGVFRALSRRRSAPVSPADTPFGEEAEDGAAGGGALCQGHASPVDEGALEGEGEGKGDLAGAVRHLFESGGGGGGARGSELPDHPAAPVRGVRCPRGRRGKELQEGKAGDGEAPRGRRRGEKRAGPTGGSEDGEDAPHAERRPPGGAEVDVDVDVDGALSSDDRPRTRSTAHEPFETPAREVGSGRRASQSRGVEAASAPDEDAAASPVSSVRSGRPRSPSPAWDPESPAAGGMLRRSSLVAGSALGEPGDLLRFEGADADAPPAADADRNLSLRTIIEEVGACSACNSQGSDAAGGLAYSEAGESALPVTPGESALPGTPGGLGWSPRSPALAPPSRCESSGRQSFRSRTGSCVSNTSVTSRHSPVLYI